MSEDDNKKKPDQPGSPDTPGAPDKPAGPDQAPPAAPVSPGPASGEAAAVVTPPPVPTPIPGMPGQPPQLAIPDTLPILPIRGTVVFPGTVMPLAVGRPSSRRLLDESLPVSKIIGLVTQRDEDEQEPSPQDLYEIGAAAMVLKLIRQPDETVSIIVHGLSRIQVKDMLQLKPYFRANIERVAEKPSEGKGFAAAVNQLREQARELIQITPNAPEQALTVLMNIEDASNLADFLAANLNLSVQQKQDLLEEPDVAKRVRTVHQHVSNQLEIVRLQQKIQQDVQSSIGDMQRKHFLREQLKAIQKELGESEDSNTQVVAELRRKLEEAQPPEKVMTEAQRDLNRLESIPPASPEYSLILTYLELLADLPWKKSSKDNLDLKRARRILDRDHFDLEKVKRRLIEYLAVRKLNPEGRGPILCLVGPPGVGKTSLGQSIADALGRKFVRMSFGGIRDEAEIRGHRRTYIGAMPGRIIQEMRRAGTNNPVMMLDEIDKLGADFRGDPASALLEVLDPRQNNAFVDRYLDVPFDLSQVIFIATANYMGTVPPALHDRMEVIDIPGYTDNEKVQIATRYLVPRQIKENGLTAAGCRWTAQAIRKAINDYTREAGVRDLERQIGAVCRGLAAEVAEEDAAKDRRKKGRGAEAPVAAPDGGGNGKAAPPAAPVPPAPKPVAPVMPRCTVTPEVVRKLLGAERYFREADVGGRTPGIVIGLAYTPVGGEVLFVEAASYPGRGRITLTGHIGDVMKESASAALSLFKSRSATYGFDVRGMAERDLHIHVPAGAVPKDGPSAGVAMYTAIASLLLDLPVQPHLAMTGEITLRGLVLPIGGVKEKTLAAARAGIRTVILPEKNRRDLEEIDPEVRQKVKFWFVNDVGELLAHALGKARLQAAIRANGKHRRNGTGQGRKRLPVERVEGEPEAVRAASPLRRRRRSRVREA